MVKISKINIRTRKFKIIFIPMYSNPYQKSLADSLFKKGVEVSFITNFHKFSGLSSFKNYWKPDILHIHWPHVFLLSKSKEKTILKSLCFISELLILKLLGIKIIWTVHNIISHESNFKAIELFFTKIITRLCNKIIVHSPFAKNKVINIYKVRKSLIMIIPHGNYINCYENVISKVLARKQLQLRTENIVFLCFGQIRPYKGISELITTFKKLKYKQAKLLIIGKPYNSEIAKEILERCNIDESIKCVFKFIPDNEVQIYMNAADVAILPYKDILTSGAIILAISFGKPIIAPAIGCIPDILDSEGSILYDPSEKEGLLKAMKQVSNVDLKKMGEHNFELASNLQWDEIAKRTYDIYKKCLDKK